MRPMRVMCVVTLFTGMVGHAEAPLSAKPIASISLPDLKEGDFDHFALDDSGQRLFLTAEANGAVVVIDIRKQKVIRSIEGLIEPHSILYRADKRRMFVVDGGASEVKVYDTESFALTGRIRLTIDADSMSYDPKTTEMYVVNGGRKAHRPYSMISVVDTTGVKKIADIKIDSAWLEGLAVERNGSRLFCNDAGNNRIVVIDRVSRRVVSNWPIPADTSGLSPMRLDEANHRLFVATRKSPKFMVLDSNSGKVIAELDCAGLVDDIAYDPESKRIYLSGDKVIEVLQQRDADHYEKVGVAAGAFRAKTGILVPERRSYYLAVPKHGSSPAMVWVYSVGS
jgi:DNA-binding beta-propeller fold protein YncE